MNSLVMFSPGRARLLVVLLLGVAGCNSGGTTKAPLPPASQSKVRAQGQILPSSGIVRIAATPGDIVDSIEVEVGQTVKEGDELLVLRSAALRQKQRAALQAQRAAALEEQEQAVQQASQNRRIAEEKLASLSARTAGLEKQHKMLDLAAQQLETSRELLTKLEAISTDKLTGEFVGELQVDRQRLAVGEANLKYQQQQAEYQQAEQDLESAQRAAKIELEIANELYESLQSNASIAVVDAQLGSLDEEIEASRIKAPLDGTILSINTKVGEAAAQFPLIEMASLDDMVCEVEVNEIDAARVQPGDPAVVTSRAFTESLRGVVKTKSVLIGRPTLRPVDPLARTDFRAVTTVIELDDPELAHDWLQLHVQAEILTGQDQASSSKQQNPSTEQAAESASPSAETE